MSDIEKLIERLRAKRRDMTCDDYDAILGEAADALTRLVAPLSAEVAEEAGYLRMLAKAAVPDLPHVTLPDSLRDIADMLESQAREVDYLQGRHQQAVDEGLAVCVERDRLAAEIDRLRAELDEIRTAAHASPDEPLAAVVFDMRTRLLAALDGGRELAVSMARAQNEAAVLRDEMDVAKAALLELSQLGGGRSEGNWIAQRAMAKLDAMKGGA